MLYCIVLYCIVLYCIVLYCIVLYCIVLYCICNTLIIYLNVVLLGSRLSVISMMLDNNGKMMFG